MCCYLNLGKRIDICLYYKTIKKCIKMSFRFLLWIKRSLFVLKLSIDAYIFIALEIESFIIIT